MRAEFNGLVVSDPPDVRLCDDRSDKLMAFVSVVLNGAFKVANIRVVLLPDGRHVVAMPSRRGEDGVHRDMAYPIDRECRRWLDRIILDAYARECVCGAVRPPSIAADPTAVRLKEAV